MSTRGSAAAAVLVLTAAAWMGACGGDESGSDSATLGLSGRSPEDTQKAYCEAFAKEFCAARTKCCDALPPDGLFSCEQSLLIGCNNSTTAELRDGWVFSGERIDATIGRLRTAAANCGAYDLPADGDPFAPQEVAVGESCTLFSTAKPCADGMRCVGSKCAVLLREGDACSNSSTNPCATGLNCTGGVCQPVGEEGEACRGSGGRGNSAGCVSSLYCVPTDTSPLTNGAVCAPLRAAGQTCGEDTDCASRNCSASTCVACTTDASCNLIGGRCTGGVCSAVFDYCGEPSYIDD